MTLPPEKIGDKGQRYAVKYKGGRESQPERTLGYSPTKEGAEAMAAAWTSHPEEYDVWIVDREQPAELGQEEGETCNRDGCTGTIEVADVENCSCHISPPCGACTDPREFCPRCDWQAKDDPQ